MGHGHHHYGDPSTMSERRLMWAVGANILLTAAQVIGGLFSGSLSLIADALHNFSDAASLFIALIAIRIGRKPADELKTFGYKRAETIAALINFITLIIIGFYLCFEAISRFITPEPITGWTIIIVAAIALVVDIFTAALTYKQSKCSMNMRAAFLHNLTDALASLGVIIAGVLILLYGWVWTDAAMTLIIAGYVLYHGFHEIPKVIHLLMLGTPEGINVSNVTSAMQTVEGVDDAYHVHIWQLDEQLNALEAHIIISDLHQMEYIKADIKEMLYDDFKIHHATLEFEAAF